MTTANEIKWAVFQIDLNGKAHRVASLGFFENENFARAAATNEDDASYRHGLPYIYLARIA